MVIVILSNDGGELDRRDADAPATVTDQPALHALMAMLGTADLQPGDVVRVVEDETRA